MITTIKVLPNFTAATVKANVETAVKAFLSPEKWGNPEAATTGANTWINYVGGIRLYAIVRYNSIIGVIEAVPGVAYVKADGEGLKVGLEPTPTGTSDVPISGPAPLPQLTELEVKTE